MSSVLSADENAARPPEPVSAPLGQKAAARFIFLCAAVYFFSYVSRINYGAVLVSIIQTEGYSKPDASAALTGLFITYGLGQFVSGYLGDRLPPHRLITAGLLVSAAMNLLVPLCPDAAATTAVWCVNGFAQALMWPPLVRLMSGLLTDADYEKAVVRVSWGSSFGTIFVYLAAPVCVTLGGWRPVFVLSAALTAGMALVWALCVRRLPALETLAPRRGKTPAAREKRTGGLPGGLLPLLAAVMLSIVLQGVLRDGITTWTPSYVSELFHLGSAPSILAGVVLPVFSIFSFYFTSLLNRRVLKNELVCAGAIFAACFLSLLALRFFGAAGPVFSVAALALAVGCMHGVNLLLICSLPAHFRNTGRISLISGLLNSCTYAGSALSAYGIAAVTERAGWSATVLVWCAAALGGTLCCALCARSWQRFREAENPAARASR